MGRVRLSVELPLHGSSFTEVREVALAAEAAAFDALCVPDQLVPLRPGGPPPSECWTTLSAIAALTSKVELGPLVLVLGLRNPALVAVEASTLDRLVAGRSRLAVGLGGFTYARATAMLGLPHLALAERVAELGRGIETLRDAWARAAARRIPITVAGRSGELIALAARTADGWNCPFAAELAERTRQLDDACARAGRRPGDVERSVYCLAAIGRTEREAERARTEGAAMERLFGDVRAHHVFGTPEAALDRLLELSRGAVSEIMLHLLGRHETRLAAIELCATEIIPGLASAATRA